MTKKKKLPFGVAQHSAAARAKRAKTLAQRRADKAAGLIPTKEKPPRGPAPVADARAYLRHAAGDVIGQIRQGELTLKTLRESHLLTLLAYFELSR